MSILALKEKFNSLTLESEDHWDYRGNTNSERDYVHGFCTYPAMMVPKMQREMLDVCLEHLQDTTPCLLDPFAGSGTILVEGMLRGLDIVGIDVNPLAILLCKVKTTILDPTILSEKTTQLIDRISAHDNVPLHQFNGINKWFTDQAISDLSRIRSGIIAEEEIEYRRFFWATFCEIVRVVSNSRDCTYKLHIKEQDEIDAYDKDAIDLFKTALQYNICKYNEFYSELKARGHLKRDGLTYKRKVKIVLGDSIAYLNHSKQKYSLVFTSPPYGDNHTTVSYAKTREVYVAYRKAGYSKKFLAEHEAEILLHKAAKKAFDEMGIKKMPTIKSLQAEYAGLLTEKKKLYPVYSGIRQEMRDLQMAKANVARLLGYDEKDSEKEKEAQRKEQR